MYIVWRSRQIVLTILRTSCKLQRAIPWNKLNISQWGVVLIRKQYGKGFVAHPVVLKLTQGLKGFTCIDVHNAEYNEDFVAP